MGSFLLRSNRRMMTKKWPEFGMKNGLTMTLHPKAIVVYGSGTTQTSTGAETDNGATVEGVISGNSWCSRFINVIA